MVLSNTPSAANTKENPNTKKILFTNISRRLACAPPARYARNPGIIGKTHGERNDTIPATNATVNGMSFIRVFIRPPKLGGRMKYPN
jgi:hypothetical protein